MKLISLILAFSFTTSFCLAATPEPYATTNKVLSVVEKYFHETPGSLSYGSNLGKRYSMTALDIGGILGEEFGLDENFLGEMIYDRCYVNTDDGPFGLPVAKVSNTNAVCIAKTILSMKRK